MKGGACSQSHRLREQGFRYQGSYQLWDRLGEIRLDVWPTRSQCTLKES